QTEDLTDLDAPVLAEGTALAARTRIAPAGLPEVGEDQAGEITRLVDVHDVLVGAIRTADHPTHTAQRRVGHQPRLEPDRSGEADRRTRHPLDRRLVGQGHRLAAQRGLELGLGELVVAPYERRDDASALRAIEQGLDEALRRLAEKAAHLLHRPLSWRGHPLERARRTVARRRRPHL